MISRHIEREKTIQISHLLMTRLTPSCGHLSQVHQQLGHGLTSSRLTPSYTPGHWCGHGSVSLSSVQAMCGMSLTLPILSFVIWVCQALGIVILIFSLYHLKDSVCLVCEASDVSSVIC